ncbi:MAG TPA: NADPH-dependent assimilatory sulfite reductase hemoprotein subunit [Steroidobacteraceae bacterium]|nr:NADPH-dependent assimilatory sulfite reductase hemoprotein subunit [Steroidobacteraceae bacterium]
MSSPPRRFDLSRPLAELNPNEQAKYDSQYLRGTLQASLADPVTGAVGETDTLFTKFFGIYQQDDRDLRDDRRRAKLEPRYQFMVRVRLPGGVCTPRQWLSLDALAREYAGSTLRLTTRQTFQFHGIRKRHLRAHIQGINAAGLDTVAACGDDNRNVICTANPLQSPAHAEVSALAKLIGRHLLPRTGAYEEVFLETTPKAPRSGSSAPRSDAEEPLYGRTYLPRKFKIALAIPPHNDVDVFAHDLGFVANVENGRISGYNVAVGGGMGMTHRVPATFPRLGEVIGFCAPEDVCAVAAHSMCIQRDYGDRKDRSHARFKYTIEDRGVAWFRAELERRTGRPLQGARAFHFDTSGDRSGWYQGADGRWHYGLFVQNGRIADLPGQALLTGLRAIAASHAGVFALTTNQNLILAGIAEHDRAGIERLLGDHAIGTQGGGSALRRNSLACVALPTCGLAMAESERYLPQLLDKLEVIVAAAGLEEQPISIRMTGCPNGCARPYLAEIALVGKAPGKYNLYMGASANGDRLNALYRENIGEREILEALRPVLHRYAGERSPGEAFGDFVVRAGFVRAMRHGRDFQRASPAGPGG